VAHYRAAVRTVGNYRLKSLIGRGGTSEVYSAEHALLGGVVAIKLLRPELADDSTQAIALVDEGTKVRTIDHPNVVRVLDAGLDPESHGCYLVMEHVAGETLSARLRREGPLPETEVRRLGAELADGVAAAHARGIVHRDLKPANVMLEGTRPKIVDFGIAKHLGTRSAVTTGRMVGTLAYMAPEQLSSGLIAPCTDIWALGVIVFEALTGRHPFQNFDDGRCPQLFDEPAHASSLVDVSPALDGILARCLSRDPAGRPASAEQLARLLRGDELIDDERVTADAGPVSEALAPTIAAPLPRRRRTWMFVAGGVVVLATSIIGVALATRSKSTLAPAVVMAPVRITPVVTTPPPVVSPPPTTTSTKPAPRAKAKRKVTPPRRRETLD
jgi:serine/threonine protein kinase